MGNRVYDRQTQLWEWDTLHRLEAEGKATRITDHGLWIVKKDEGGQVVVRDSQVLVYDGMTQEQCDDQSKAEIAAEMGYERWLEDGGPHAASIAAEDEYEQRMEAMDVGLMEQRARREESDLVARFTPPKEGS